jgi:hypothetical protein
LRTCRGARVGLQWANGLNRSRGRVLRPAARPTA